MTKRKQRYPQSIITDATTENTPNARVVKIKHKIVPQNFSQEMYLESLRESSITIGEGPAGSGKTYLVIAVALEKLIANEVTRIVLTRPVVESDEKLGFLPGSLKEKLDPYLLPLYDAIEDHVGPTMAKKLMDSGRIEIAPLAYMRGRTFNNCFVILDEAQNSTVKQMKMFLTRIGYDSFYCVDGDVTQSDLTPPRGVSFEDFENGLEFAIRKLTGKSRFVNLVQFTSKDIVRSEQAKEIVMLLEGPDERREAIESRNTRNGNSRASASLSSPTDRRLDE